VEGKGAEKRREENKTGKGEERKGRMEEKKRFLIAAAMTVSYCNLIDLLDSPAPVVVAFVSVAPINTQRPVPTLTTTKMPSPMTAGGSVTADDTGNDSGVSG